MKSMTPKGWIGSRMFFRVRVFLQITLLVNYHYNPLPIYMDNLNFSILVRSSYIIYVDE